jgi:hypothetical protein
VFDRSWCASVLGEAVLAFNGSWRFCRKSQPTGYTIGQLAKSFFQLAREIDTGHVHHVRLTKSAECV